ncbi:MAG TPA: hypothetical protein DEB06_05665 [Phycisphaerales bacterium]|nr:hypothetical protein [Phycisphaerales bacterium]
MAVPAHDTRDFEFARAFDLPIRDVVYPRVVLAMSHYARHAASDEQRGSQWVAVLADFLALLTTSAAGPEGFAHALASVRDRRRAQPDAPGVACEMTPEVLAQIPGGLGERRGVTRGSWIETLESMGFDSFDDFRRCFDDGAFYARCGAAFTAEGVAVNCEPILGLPTDLARRRMGEWLHAQGRGRPAVQYKLRDWLFSRQRYWGEPFPIVYREDDEHGAFPIALPESELPLTLPDMDDFRPVAGDDPTAAPRPPLGRAADWARVTLDLGDGPRPYRRELNTMPQWAGSCWYYLRYLDPENSAQFVSPEAERYWMRPGEDGQSTPGSGGVDLYVGGAEHAVLHLLYARFWHKVLFDLGHVSTVEPFHKLFNQGYIQAPAFTDERGVYVEATQVVEQPAGSGRFVFDGRPVQREFGKMGKSLKNVVTPDDVCEEYGADTMRLYEMAMGPLEQSKPWNPRDIVGAFRFLQRVWRSMIDEESGAPRVSDAPLDTESERLLHRTIEGVRRDIEGLSFNTAISKLIELNNHFVKAYAEALLPRAGAEAMVLMVAPFTPHFAEELWSRLGRAGSVVRQPFPRADPALLAEERVEIPVQVQGKVRGRIVVPAGASAAQVEAAALADEKVAAFLAGKPVRKVIVVPGKMVNIVAG